METAKVRVWDGPVRLVHWALVALIGFAWWSYQAGHLDWHKMAGSTVVGLLVFRLWWGVFGGSTARFSDFIKGPGAIIAHLFPGKNVKPHSLGHNPLGGLSVAALLLTILTIVASGLFASDTDGIDYGPLSNLVDYDQSRLASLIHSTAFTVLQCLVILHLLAIAFYGFVLRKPLVGAMIHGRKPAEEGAEPLKPAGLWALIVGIVLGVAATVALLRLGS